MEADLLGPTVTNPNRWRMSCVNHPRGPRRQIDSHELPSHEHMARRVSREGLVGQPGLLGKTDPTAARVAERSDEHRGQQSRLEGVPHRVGHREMQNVALEAEVKSVAGHVASGF